MQIAYKTTVCNCAAGISSLLMVIAIILSRDVGVLLVPIDTLTNTLSLVLMTDYSKDNKYISFNCLCCWIVCCFRCCCPKNINQEQSVKSRLDENIKLQDKSPVSIQETTVISTNATSGSLDLNVNEEIPCLHQEVTKFDNNESVSIVKITK
eukprot:541566_1